MATSQTRQKKGKRPAALPRHKSNTKLTMKYVELDPDNAFTISTNDRTHYEVGELYQVTDDDGQDFTFKGVKSLANVELTPEIYDILQKVVVFNDIPKIEAYARDCILRGLGADVDYIFQDQLRKQYQTVIDKAKKRAVK